MKDGYCDATVVVGDSMLDEEEDEDDFFSRFVRIEFRVGLLLYSPECCLVSFLSCDEEMSVGGGWRCGATGVT